MGKGALYKSEEGREFIAWHYERYVDSMPFDVERRYVDTSYGKTHVLVAGPSEGKPVFIFQGGNCINPMTLSWFSPLAGKYRIYAPDTIGHPGYSAEDRISAKDHSFAQWIEELMNDFHINRSAFVGSSYGAGVILRLAAFLPEKIACSVLVSPAGIGVGSKVKMIKDILLPLVLFHVTSSEKFLNKITDIMSDHTVKEIDKRIIADIFRYIKLEQEMPKLTEKKELTNYDSPTLLIAGKKISFFLKAD
ncbi:alpha/beta fold hydrolase [Bacillus thermotolerans]|uniref:Carboxylesterase NA n=1 Tax=Bacillus thermotolerans TaxID=1221996 RepID=A0A0F5I3J5_BACTR|nr:alpha/beta fold hydrolase [Bacillus thermotolerans]KKB36981.1 carboxylesterase NA [Bacillus thermotolerans]KKB40018.1 carboxylesterase NA [Bacillus thermotolerans]